MKFNIFLLLYCTFQILALKANDLKELEKERELLRLVKTRLHGEPLELLGSFNASALTFSPDGKHLAVASASRPVLIYDITAEKAKRLDHELEKIKQEISLGESTEENLPENEK